MKMMFYCLMFILFFQKIYGLSFVFEEDVKLIQIDVDEGQFELVSSDKTHIDFEAQSDPISCDVNVRFDKGVVIVNNKINQKGCPGFYTIKAKQDTIVDLVSQKAMITSKKPFMSEFNGRISQGSVFLYSRYHVDILLKKGPIRILYPDTPREKPITIKLICQDGPIDLLLKSGLRVMWENHQKKPQHVKTNAQFVNHNGDLSLKLKATQSVKILNL